MKFGLREILFTALLAAIPVGAWWFVLRPTNRENERLAAEIEQKRRKLHELSKVMVKIGDLQKEIDDYQDAIVFFQARLPSEKEMDKVLQEIWRLAENSRLKTKSIRTLRKTGRNAIVVGTGPSEQPIAVQIEGDFTGLYAFLQALENLPRIMRVTRMDLRKLDKDAPEGSVEVSFEMSVFFEKEGKDAS